MSDKKVEHKKLADELIIAHKELGKIADELIIVHKELAFQEEEKIKKLTNELIIAHKELGKIADELIIANKELAFQNEEKEKRADELIIANKELAFQNEEKEKLKEKIINFQNTAQILNDFNKNLIKTIPYDMEIIDKNGNILFINQLLKNKVGDVIGQKCWNVHRDDKKQCVGCPLYSEIEIGIPKIVESIGLHNGSIYEINHIGILYNNEKAILEIFQDITERKRNEELLKLSEEKFLKAFQTSFSPIIITAMEDGKIIEVNDAFKLTFGYSRDESIHSSSILLNLWVDINDRNFVVNSLKNNIEIKNKEFKFKTKDGNLITGLFSAQIIYLDNTPYILSSLLDISERKRSEEALEKSNAIKSVFLSNISHELRTPMNAIIGYSDLILSNNKNKDTDRFLKSINSNAKHLDELLNNILDYSKIESESLDILYEQFSIFDLFDELYDIFEDENYKKNLDFVKLEFIKNQDKKITSDYLRLKQVLYNIISNSIKFTEKGYIKFSFTSDKKYVIFKIEDTGIGIPEDKLAFVFDRFWQCDSTSRKKYKGTGLGLSISKSIVEMLNGEIWLESKLDKGSTFYVKIPIEEQNQKIIKNEIDFPGKTILVIDDVPITYSLLGIYLNYLHINTISSIGGKQAIEIYKQQKEKIDLIILDLNLFDMSSFELIKTIKEICGDCKIISKSGIENQKNELVDYHLKKPINKDILISIFNDIWH